MLSSVSLSRYLSPVILALLVFPISSGPIANDNDSAASIAAGGIQLRSEPSISMEKERLTIGLKKVEAEYEFLNESERDITTEVAFPIPHYQCDGSVEGQDPHFRDFHVWVEGTELQYQTTLRAIVNGEDRTKFLTDAKISPATIEINIDQCYDPEKNTEIAHLTPAARKKLIQAGLIDEDGAARWTVEKIYHWPMTFPAHKTVHVRQEYSPVIGQSQIPEGYFRPIEANLQGKSDSTGLDGHPTEIVEQYSQLFRNACADVPVVEALQAKAGSTGNITWVDYVLTTANTWKTPIKDFTLIVDATNPSDKIPVTANFCWDGPVTHPDPTHYVAEKKDFRPTKELAVYFLH
jgi:hypothetical protein